MLILIIISSIVSAALGTEELSSLYGVRGGNRVTLCMNRDAPGPAAARDACPGALWRRHWVLVRASCVAHRPLYPVVIVRDAFDVDCDLVDQENLYSNYRKVLARFLHPDFPEMDFALICVLDPFDAPQVTSNASLPLLNKLGIWLQHTYDGYSPESHRADYLPSEENMLFASPVRMFMASVVLPLMVFMAFFLFVTFYTGTEKSSLPYTSLKDSEHSTFA